MQFFNSNPGPGADIRAEALAALRRLAAGSFQRARNELRGLITSSLQDVCPEATTDALCAGADAVLDGLLRETQATAEPELDILLDQKQKRDN